MPSFNSQPLVLRSLLRANFTTSRPRCRTLPSAHRGTVRRPPRPIPNIKGPAKSRPDSPKDPAKPPTQADQQRSQESPGNAVSLALRNDDNNLRAPVNVPEDPHGVLTLEHPATSILSNSAIVITRQLELMNVMVGFEQANKYTIMDPQGNHIGYMAERDLGMGNMMARQMFSTHRSFTTHVFDKHGREVLRVQWSMGTFTCATEAEFI